MKEVYKAADLESRAILDEGAEKPARLAVLGYPVSHSASPAMHQPALDEQGLDMRYIRLEVEPADLAKAVARLAELDFIGCNVTVPHKLGVMECCDELSDDARELGAVNTLQFGEKIIGHNTDALGLERALREEFGKKLGDLRVMILGAGGGAGRAIATHCARIACPRLFLVNRTFGKAQSLAEELTERYCKADETKKKIVPMITEEDCLFAEASSRADLIINATSLGLKSSDPSPFSKEHLLAHHLVYDMVYKPAKTALIEDAKSTGARVAGGFSMLLHQGALSFQNWFPGSEPLEAMRHGLKEHLK